MSAGPRCAGCGRELLPTCLHCAMRCSRHLPPETPPAVQIDLRMHVRLAPALWFAALVLLVAVHVM